MCLESALEAAESLYNTVFVRANATAELCCEALVACTVHCDQSLSLMGAALSTNLSLLCCRRACETVASMLTSAHALVSETCQNWRKQLVLA